MKRIILACMMAAVVPSVQAQLPESVRQDLAARHADLKQAGAATPAAEETADPAVGEAVAFLYAYMSWPDMADYSRRFYASQAACAVRARREMPWGSKVPDREWRHFVLPVRVNNENLDTFRTACYEELKRRVAGLDMRQAALEVNHWCHEYVTYKPSDARTSSPLASMRTATGRCGEESTFTVAALRTVGIPARQVYTPRWAHTDDNHAWVEAWVDGEWCFLGACEPEPVLNLGWFNQPASRGMLMHTKVYGRYEGPEDVMARTPCNTEINVTRNYAPVARQWVQVCTADGKAAAGATVDFKLYNYAELYTVTTVRTDERGMASITAGLGDMVAWATKAGHYGFEKFTVGRDSVVRVVLERQAGEPAYARELNITPPAGRNNLPALTPEEVARNERRKAQEDSIRTAYVRTFADSARTAAFCRKTGTDFLRLWPLVQKSCGNHEAVFNLLKMYADRPAAAGKAMDMLEAISDKDLRDFEPAVLADHLDGELSLRTDAGGERNKLPEEIEKNYLLSPRIANERLTPWRSCLQKAFSQKEQSRFRKQPKQLAAWIRRNIADDERWNPQGFYLSPESTWRTRRGDRRAKEMLFVAAARALGVAARINEVTGAVQYFAAADNAGGTPGGEWREAELFPTAQRQTEGTVKLIYTPREYMENPRYYNHFTLSRLDGDGCPTLLTYPETDTWQSTFREAAAVPAGNFLLTSGTRLADGSVLARLSVFPVSAGATATAGLVMREDREKLQVIGGFNAENIYRDATGGQSKSILSTTGRGYYVVALLRAGHEPSNHILHDLEKLRDELEAWGRPIVLLFPSQEEWERFDAARSEFDALPRNVHFGVDDRGEAAADMFGGGLTAGRELPVVLLADTFNRVVFATQGYTIGIGEQIKQALKKLR